MALGKKPKALLFSDYIKKKKETVGTSAAPAVTRDGVKRESKEVSALPHAMNFRARLRESDAQPAQGGTPGRRFSVVLIQEGLGNLRDGYYYTRECIESAAPVFEGKKFFADHPAEDEEQVRPERSVRDIAGYFENVHPEDDADGRSQLCGDVVVLDGKGFDWVRSLMQESIAYAQKHPDKDLIGLSINAGGEDTQANLEQFLKTESIPPSCLEKLQEAASQGLTTIRPVQRLTSAVSCDLVTEAGAGGKVKTILEKEKSRMKKETEKKEAFPGPAKGDAKDDKDSKKESEEKEAGQGGEGAEDPQAGHADAAQDEDLIMKMLKKYCGDGFSDDEKSMAKEAMEAARQIYPDDESGAMRCAGENMKMARHLASKAPAAPVEAAPPIQPGSVPKQVEAKKEGEESEESKKESEESEESKKEKKETKMESNRGEASKHVIALTAENAALKQKLQAIDLEKFMDKTLRESGLPMSATKRFRECVKESKSEKEVTEKLNLFKEAFRASGEADGIGFILNPEKQSSQASAGAMSFSDCVEE